MAQNSIAFPTLLWGGWVGGVIFCWIFYFPFQRKCVSCFQPKSWYSILCRGQLSHFRKLSDWLHLIQVFFQEVSRANNFKRKLVIKDSEAAFSGNIQIEMRGMDIEASLSQTSFLHLQKQELSVAVLLNCAIWDILQKLTSKLLKHNFNIVASSLHSNFISPCQIYWNFSGSFNPSLPPLWVC